MLITLWDENAARLQDTSANLCLALKTLHIKAEIILNSEPPLLSRMDLLGRTPIIEINNYYWRCTIGKEISCEQFIELFKTHIL